MKKTLLIIMVLLTPLRGITQIQLGQDIDGEVAYDQSGWSVSMPDAYTVAIGAPWNEGNGPDAGHVRIYRWNGSSWVQKGLDIDGETSVSYSGYSVGMPDANTIAIGANRNSGNGSYSGNVRVYRWDGSSWIQKGTDIDGEAAWDESGCSVSMPDTNTVAVGAYRNDGNGTSAGHVRIYRWDGSSWVQKGMDVDGEVAYDQSGWSVSMSDTNTVAIGAPWNDGNGTDAGHVRVYSWNGSGWVQKGTDIDGEAAGDQSGWSVSMPDTNTVAIGAYENDGNGTDAGHVRVYRWNGSGWVQKGIDIDGEAAGDELGYSVSMPDTNTVAIGARKNDGNGINAGHVRVYHWEDSSWVQKGVDINGEAGGDESGFSVSMPDTNIVAIGAPYNGGNGGSAGRPGHVRIYQLKGVHGLVYNDLNQNCTKEESGIVVGVKGIVQPGNIIVETDFTGRWLIDSLPAGNYTITYDTLGDWRVTCPHPDSFTVTNPNGFTEAPDFGMVNTNPCAEPTISVTMPFMRPGFSNQNLYVRACNQKTGTGTLDSAYVILELDSLLIPQSSSLAYTALGNHQYGFDLGTINPGECNSFSVACSLSVDAVLGQTLCMEAELYPVDSCVLDTIPSDTPPDFTPCSLPWDKSSISVNGWCQNDSIYFTITNTGEPGGGDMDCYSPVRLFIDGSYISLDSVQLPGGTTDTLVYAGDGRTWRLEVDQHPLHPGNSQPNTTVELCGNANNWTSNLVNILPMDDADPVVDIYCGLVTGSYDPNDKQGFPLGVTDTHFVAPNGKIDYMIRFQNTGTDTAFTVIIRDTLDTDLNIFSVRSGASSHNYSFRMYGPRVLEWRFDDILLPDSGTNQDGSNGFVSFTVNQVKNLPDFTNIDNSAAIYFDFNAPVITNMTTHVVHRKVLKPSWNAQKTITGEDCDVFSYNNFVYTQSGSYWQIENDTLITVDVAIYKLFSTIMDTACNSYTSPSGKVWTASNTYLDTVANGAGCDSIITINLTIHQNSTASVDTSILNGESYTIGSNTYTSEGTYIDTLLNGVGCDSIVTTNITVISTGIEDDFDGNLKIYPNPTKSVINIEILEGLELIGHIILKDNLGRVVKSEVITTRKAQVDMKNITNGIYYLEIETSDKKLVKKVVKE